LEGLESGLTVTLVPEPATAQTWASAAWQGWNVMPDDDAVKQWPETVLKIIPVGVTEVQLRPGVMR